MSEPILNLSPLPFAFDAFANYLSVESFEYHYLKHHKSYVDNLNNLLANQDNYLNTKNEKLFLNDLIVKSYENIKSKQIKAVLNSLTEDEKIFNNAAQHWNHTFFWNSISPIKKDISSKMVELLEKSFSSIEEFVKNFKNSATSLFGSGWVWLVFNQESSKLEILQTSNAFTPIVQSNYVPLLVCDVWEHAYYIDYRNKRVDFVQIILDHLNWEFAQENLDSIENK